MFENGDIVWWNEWVRNEDDRYASKKKYGVIIEIKIKKSLYNERSVFVAIVLPFGETRTRELSLHLLNKDTN